VEAVLLEFLSRKGLSPASAIAVAYSGGPDSTALLAALSAIARRVPIAIYVDHGIRDRGELDAELALVEASCSRLGARLFVARVRAGAVLERAAASGEGVEAEARRFRYVAFRTAMRRTGAEALLLAHTRDDQLETILMRLFSGAGAGGIKGIPEVSGPIFRPFLGIGKSALLAYLAGRGIAYSVDSTNASEDFLRNRIRRVLVSALDADFPGWRRGLSRTAAKAARDEEALSAAAAALAFTGSPGVTGALSASSALLLGAPAAVASRAIVRAAGSILGKERFSSGMAAAALDALRGGEGCVYRGAGLELRIRDGLAILRRGLDFPKAGGYFVFIDRPRRVRVGSLEVNASWRVDGSSGIRADAFRFPLVVRSRRPGDAIALKDGTKRLDALFSEWALPEKARGLAPVVEDRDGIVAVLGLGFGGKDRYRALPKGVCPVGECARFLSVIVKGA
jgi:tRNA(Ile)-lysidine synthase